MSYIFSSFEIFIISDSYPNKKDYLRKDCIISIFIERTRRVINESRIAKFVKWSRIKYEKRKFKIKFIIHFNPFL